MATLLFVDVVLATDARRNHYEDQKINSRRDTGGYDSPTTPG